MANPSWLRTYGAPAGGRSAALISEAILTQEICAQGRPEGAAGGGRDLDQSARSPRKQCPSQSASRRPEPDEPCWTSASPSRRPDTWRQPIGRAARRRVSLAPERGRLARQFADRAAGMRGGWLLPLRRAYDILVRDRLVIALLLALEIKIADAERAGAVIDAEHAAFLLVAGRDEPVVAGLLLCRAVAAAVAVGDPERARPDIGSSGIVGELAGDHVASQFIEPIDQGKIDLRRGEKLVLSRFAPLAPRRPQPRRRRAPRTRILQSSLTLPTSAQRKSRRVSMEPSAFINR